MSQSTQADLVQEANGLPGTLVLTRIRRLIIVAVLAAVGYVVLMSASKVYCPGGMNSEGEFVDAMGAVVEVAPSCISLTLRPSVLVYLAIAAIVIGVVTKIIRRATDQHAAFQYIDRGAAAIAILVVASIVVSQVWFAMIPITDWDGGETFFYPFPIGSVDLVISPMPTP